MSPSTAKVITTTLATLIVASATISLSPISSVQAQEPGWRKVCTKQEDNDICVVQNRLIAPTGQLLTAVGLITVKGKTNNRLLQVTVPAARAIPPGVAMSIDGAEAQRIPFAVCMPDKCVAQVPLTDGIVDTLKKGSEVVFTSVNFQRAANPITVSLSGFTGAYDGEPLTQAQLQELDDNLREEMQRKEQEFRDKLNTEQTKAKETN